MAACSSSETHLTGNALWMDEVLLDAFRDLCALKNLQVLSSASAWNSMFMCS